MNLPFTVTQFVAVFSSYNASIGLLPILAYAAGAAILAIAIRGCAKHSAVGGALLAAMWAFTGIGYHILSFARINPVARVFGVMFVIEAVLLAVASLRGKLRLRFDGSARSWFGAALAAWAMVGYPLAGYLGGHGYPNGPVFGLTPCPLVLFTFGVLCLAEMPPRYVVSVPILWALVGTTAALSLGIREDATLLLAAIAFVTLSLRHRRSAGRSAVARGEGRGLELAA